MDVKFLNYVLENERNNVCHYTQSLSCRLSYSFCFGPKIYSTRYISSIMQAIIERVYSLIQIFFIRKFRIHEKIEEKSQSYLTDTLQKVVHDIDSVIHTQLEIMVLS